MKNRFNKAEIEDNNDNKFISKLLKIQNDEISDIE